MFGNWSGTVWTLLVTFCIVIIRCTEKFWSPCILLYTLVYGPDPIHHSVRGLYRISHLQILMVASFCITSMKIKYWIEMHVFKNSGFIFTAWRSYQNSVKLPWWLNRACYSIVCKRPTNVQGSSGYFIINMFQFYPDMFRHMIAILRGSWVPYKLHKLFLISSFRRVFSIACNHLGCSPAYGV
jgi:hypothetical protein